jgi:DNA-binding NarL/FixJ family response regulator
VGNSAAIQARDVDALLAAASSERSPFPAEVIEQLMRVFGADRAGYVEHRVGESLGVEDELQIRLPAPEPEARLFWFCRDRSRRDFGDREQELARLLAPHLARHREAWEARRRPAGLTKREAEILELLAEGLTNAEIAAAVTISTGTVRKHLENIYEKLDVHTRTAAAAARR